MDGPWVISAYISLGEQVKRWHACQSSSLPIMRTLCDFHARAHLFSHEVRSGSRSARTRTLGILAQRPELLSTLRHKHLVGINNLMAALRDTVRQFAEVCRSLGNLYSAVWQRHASHQFHNIEDAVMPLLASAPGKLGVDAREQLRVPSVMQCIEDHHEIYTACCNERCLRESILEQMSHAMDAADLSRLNDIWTLQPELDAERMELVSGLCVSLTS
mmetsp:Transcript_22159/g.69090  ORF Transcript_22159/g.69090 Transcript_22159/m.69090 type:complete len:217 (+) Transcript_22159:68-718(+)